MHIILFYWEALKNLHAIFLFWSTFEYSQREKVHNLYSYSLENFHNVIPLCNQHQVIKRAYLTSWNFLLFPLSYCTSPSGWPVWQLCTFLMHSIVCRFYISGITSLGFFYLIYFNKYYFHKTHSHCFKYW